jgi:hypothetical protein
MSQSVSHVRLSQPTLFHPPHPSPSFQLLPQEIQEQTIQLLAQLLRLRADQILASGQAREVRDE